jgi:hypothetical protein
LLCPTELDGNKILYQKPTVTKFFGRFSLRIICDGWSETRLGTSGQP